jgi:hypothetical protein
MGVSTRNRQVHTASFFKFDEIFTADRAFFSDHFGIRKLGVLPPSSLQNMQNTFFVFIIFSKKNGVGFLKNLILVHENSFKLYIQGNIRNPHVKLHQNPSRKIFFLIFLG